MEADNCLLASEGGDESGGSPGPKSAWQASTSPPSLDESEYIHQVDLTFYYFYELTIK